MKYLFYIVSALIAFTGCIRDEIEPCPPLQVHIGVKDKNYFNIEAVEKLGLERHKEEDLPFREYVSTLYWILKEAGTGRTIQEQTVMTVTGDAQEVLLSFPQELPFGQYILTAWGNLQSERPLSDDASVSDLHLYNAEGNDIYLVNDTLTFDAYHYDYTVEMERVKGKLIILAENLPDHINYSTKEVDSLFAYVTSDLRYGRTTSVRTDTLWQEPNHILTKTLLCPSTDIDASTLSIDFYSVNPDEPTSVRGGSIAPDDIRISMRRNELTILRYVYIPEGEPGPGPDPDPDPEPEPDPDPDPEPGPDPGPDEPEPDPDPDVPEPEPGEGTFKLYILVNGNWEVFHGMELE